MSEFLAQRRADKPAEQRMGTVRTGTIFRMELCSQEPGMVLEFDDFNQPAVGRETAQHQSLRRQRLTVRVVEFEPVPVSFANFVHTVHFVGERALSKTTEVTSQPHCSAF